ncbi:MAG TPA: hypothetical protein VI522_01930, partial [Gammaproteobacteria bacterium]|nr:hypothetical protein [Gammaproteobacteria bacterium]
IARYLEKSGVTPKNIEFLRQNFWWVVPIYLLFLLLGSSFMHVGFTQLSMSILTRRKMPFWGAVRLALYGMFSPSLWGLITMSFAVMFLVQLGGLGLVDLMLPIAMVFFSASIIVQINSKVGAFAAIRRAIALITARPFDVIGILVMFFVFNIAGSFLVRAGLRVGGLWMIILFNVEIITMCRFYLIARK